MLSPRHRAAMQHVVNHNLIRQVQQTAFVEMRKTVATMSTEALMRMHRVSYGYVQNVQDEVIFEQIKLFGSPALIRQIVGTELLGRIDNRARRRAKYADARRKDRRQRRALARARVEAGA
jgi:hypothetical protein